MGIGHSSNLDAKRKFAERAVGSLPAYDPRDKTIGFVVTPAKGPGRDAGATIAEWMLLS